MGLVGEKYWIKKENSSEGGKINVNDDKDERKGLYYPNCTLLYII